MSTTTFRLKPFLFIHGVSIKWSLCTSLYPFRGHTSPIRKICHACYGLQDLYSWYTCMFLTLLYNSFVKNQFVLTFYMPSWAFKTHIGVSPSLNGSRIHTVTYSYTFFYDIPLLRYLYIYYDYCSHFYSVSREFNITWTHIFTIITFLS